MIDSPSCVRSRSRRPAHRDALRSLALFPCFLVACGPAPAQGGDAQSPPPATSTAATAPVAAREGASTLPELEDVYRGPVHRFRHVESGLACDLPDGWSVASRNDTAVVLDLGFAPTDTLDAIVAISLGALDPEERGLAATTLIDHGEARLRENLEAQGIALQPARGKACAVKVGALAGAEQTWGATANGRPLTVWLGGVATATDYVAVTAIIVRGEEQRFLPRAKRVFGSMTLAGAASASGGGAVDLTGLEFAGGSTSSGGSLHAIYTFGANGRVTKELMMSGSIGILGEVGSDHERRGRYRIDGDAVTLVFGGDEESATIVRENGAITALRFGRALYRRS